MQDTYSAYEQGLAKLQEQLGKHHPALSDAWLYEQRLRENIRRTRRYGDTEELRAGRAEIIDQLSRLTNTALGTTFNALCLETTNEEPPKQQPSSQKILETLDSHFNLEELRTLCFYLPDVEYEDLGGEGRIGKARELVRFMESKKRVNELWATMRRLSPGLF